MTDRARILRAKILLVDDDEVSVRLLQQLLQHKGYQRVSVATDPREVSPLHAREAFDLIVLDIEMPAMDGFEVMAALQTDGRDYVPVLAVTGKPTHKLRALEGGAKDFVSKPFDWDEVFVRIYNMLQVKLLLDEAREHAKQLEAMALQDPLTGLANRRVLPERVRTAIAHARRNSKHVAIVCLDLDGFKQVNDTLGHPAGDRLLQMVADRLLEAVREEDTVARLGGDEFVVALWDVTGHPGAAIVARKLVNAIARPYRIYDKTVSVTTSAGISVFPVHGEDFDVLLRRADAALYEAKQKGKNTYRFAEVLEDSGRDALMVR
jgi:diguanylate cyclase (GGDEF)-like protein